MSYAGRPLDPDRLTITILEMIQVHKGKPCPTRRIIQEWTGIPRRKVWRFMEELQERGLIELETRSQEEGTARRLRVMGGQWTDWTERRKPSRREKMMMEAAGGQAC